MLPQQSAQSHSHTPQPPQIPRVLEPLSDLAPLRPPPFKYLSPRKAHQSRGSSTRDAMEPTSAHAAMRATLALLLPLLCSSVEQAQQPGATVREYYIAAVEIGWDYEPHPTTEQR